MVTGCIAKKVGMSRVFASTGEAVAVTYLQVEPGTIVRLKTTEKDGYNAVILGAGKRTFQSRKGKELTRYHVEKEWKVESLDGLEKGGIVAAEVISEGATVGIMGTSKGKGFQGVVKRHHFAGGPKTHGSHFKREPGSVGMREEPARVLKGKRMPGHMGRETVTLHGRPVVLADHAKGVIAIKGPIPGPNGATVFITVESQPS